MIQSTVGVRGYDGASTTPGIATWLPGGTSANAEVGMAGARLRSRSRDLVRNNPHAARIVEVLTDGIIGAGIRPRANTGDEALDKEVDTLFRQWSDVAHTEHDIDFFGLQSLCVRSWLESGEVFARRRLRLPEDGLPVPVQVQLLEADFLDLTDNREVDGGRVVQGIEYDPIDRRRLYHLYAQHPGETFGGMMRGSSYGAKVAVPASAIAHLFEAQRPGQVRGVPWLAPVVKKLRDHDDYHEAEALRKKLVACLVGIVTDSDMEAAAPLNQAQDASGAPLVDAYGKPFEGMEPGQFYYLRNGKQVTWSQPPADGGFAVWNEQSLRAIAAGARVPYELLSGDLSKVNFSSSRVGLNEYRTMVDRLRWHVVIPLLCQPIWRWFIEAAQATGKIPRRPIPAEWDPPSFSSVNPLQDVQASISRIRAGLSTLPREIASTGYSPAETLSEIATVNKQLDLLELILDTDPRRVAYRGATSQDTSVVESDPVAGSPPAESE